MSHQDKSYNQEELPAEDIDEYATETYRWWHLSEPSPELRATIEEGWLMSPGRVLDLGCGLGTELAFLAQIGFAAVGVDLSRVALSRAANHHPNVDFVQADVLNLPFLSEIFDALLDRGCFHYMTIQSRERYESEARRILRPGGRLLLRACLRSEGARNDIDETVLLQTFAQWRIVQLAYAEIPSDTRRLEALVARLERL